jgi:hypothetical protein
MTLRDQVMRHVLHIRWKLQALDVEQARPSRRAERFMNR